MRIALTVLVASLLLVMLVAELPSGRIEQRLETVYWDVRIKIIAPLEAFANRTADSLQSAKFVYRYETTRNAVLRTCETAVYQFTNTVRYYLIDSVARWVPARLAAKWPHRGLRG